MLTDRWVRLYTSGLPHGLRRARLDEIASDVFEQYADSGTGRTWPARHAVVGRTVRGAVDDLIWRREVARGMNSNRIVVRVLTQAWWAPVAVLVALFDAAMGVEVLSDSASTMPGRVVGPVLVFTAALAVAVGLSLRSSARLTSDTGRGVSRLGYPTLVVAVTAVAVTVVGTRVALILGAVVIFAAVAVAVTSLGAGRGDGGANALIVAGMLPALVMFWMVVPPLLALTVIAGLLTSRARPAPAAA
ncbi:MAG: hypothetical protein JJD92_04685 [Frankiaceae bacterium]|nr:hypothetical protein [Frankiaceae bacterium]